MVQNCRTEEDFRRLLADSQQEPVFLLKHSTRCPISAGAHTRYIAFASEHPEVECWIVRVLEERELSNAIARETGITHQSPQAILFRDGSPVWHTSHGSVTQQGLADALSR